MFSKRNVLTSCRNLRTRTSEIGVGAILGIPMAAPICTTTPSLLGIDAGHILLGIAAFGLASIDGIVDAVDH